MSAPEIRSVPVQRGLVETLAAYDVEYTFGMKILEEADHHVVKPIMIHYESTAGLMAHAYARFSGKPAVVTLNRAGTANMIMGLHEPWQSSSPLILLMDATPPQLVGKNALYEVDARGMVAPVTKVIVEAANPSQYPEALRKAFRLATSGRPRPVALHLTPGRPSGEEHVEVFAEPQFTHFPAVRIPPDPDQIRRAAELLRQAERPCIVAGGGVVLSQAWDALRDLADLTQMPVATTISGKGAFDEHHPLAVGATGSVQAGVHGRGRVAEQIVKSSDVVLLVGTRTNQMATSAWSVPDPSSTIIHVDVDPAELGRNYRTAVGLVADARLALAALQAELQDFRPRNDRTGEIRQLLDQWAEDNTRFASSDQVPIHPGRLVHEIGRFVGPSTLIASDGSSPFMWASSHLLVSAGATFISPRGTGAIGTGLPMAMGAKLARPDLDVICLEGDGGLMCGILAELETAAHYGIGVTTIVFNNGTLGHERYNMHGGQEYMDFSGGIDFAAVARGLRCDGIRVEHPDDLHRAISQGVEAGRSGHPTLIDVVIHPEQYLRMPDGPARG
jgi:acetolactate synthase-1/2/3 large subunit